MFGWETLYVVGAVVLAGLIAYGLIQYYSRDKRKDAITEEATRMEYDAPIAYEHGGREILKEEAERH
jgi:hypothetical protein